PVGQLAGDYRLPRRGATKIESRYRRSQRRWQRCCAARRGRVVQSTRPALTAAAGAPAIELRGLSKRFGDALALDHVDLVVPAGTVFGFLGRNGAGKTTALRILSGLARPTAGTARVLGHDVTHTSEAVRTRMGFLPDVPGFYPWMTAREYLGFAGRLFGLAGATLDERSDALLEMAGLASVTTRVGG